ncbi:solute carrier family 52, riboflavin transporter, member 3-like isoform X2 [Watersipora subatra]|uniref:solute carrier family 52, riboflavin transporter, member 3-like isoform X2 n=1 Tax=Watersipora subatra TaxID=2589382 RepID=UPI00355C0F53
MEWKIFTVSLLFMVFGWSSWIDVNGLWVELSLLVQRLPEGWNLPTYITVIIQTANIGPLLYTISVFLLKKSQGDTRTQSNRLETAVIFIIVVIGALSTLFLSFFWSTTSYIGGVEHSTVLLSLVFLLSLVDCTSSVTFLPFLAHFKPAYMTAFYVGEGMSGLLPTAIAFIQGSGEYTCVLVNNTGNGTNNSNLQPKYDDLLFTVQDFFLTLFIMLIMSLVAFAVLRYSQFCKDERVDRPQYPQIVGYHKTGDSSKPHNDTVDSDDSFTPIVSHLDQNSLSFPKFYALLSIMTFICALSNGFLPSIQIYSLLPYGQIYYSVGLKLAALSNPLCCFLGFFIMSKSFVVIGVLTSIVTASAAYIIVVASFSPVPPLQGQVAAVAMVLVWMLFAGTVAYLRLLISNLVKQSDRGHSGLLWLGIFTQIGSLVGAILALLLTTVFQLFNSAPQC